MNLAARGARNLDNGMERIDDEDLLKVWRRQASRVYYKSILFTAVFAALLLAL